MQQIKLTAAQRESLVNKFYNVIMSNPFLDMADIGDAETEAARLTDQWAEDNNIIFE